MSYRYQLFFGSWRIVWSDICCLVHVDPNPQPYSEGSEELGAEAILIE